MQFFKSSDKAGSMLLNSETITGKEDLLQVDAKTDMQAIVDAQNPDDIVLRPLEDEIPMDDGVTA